MSSYIWKIDQAHSSVAFSIKHMMIAKVHGAFEKFDGTLNYDPQNLSKATVDVKIDAASIDTHEPKRDAHLRSADFFDVEKFPQITFRSKRVEGSAGDIKVTGDFSMHGVTKEITLNVDGPSDEIKDPFGNTKIGLSATTKINRKDFGLKWNAALETGGVMVGDEVNIALEIQFIKQTE